jgi:rRNA processing protein Gar1
MANAIDLVVAQQAIDQLKNLITHLDLVDARMTAISANAITLAANAGKVTTPSGGSTNAGGNAAANAGLTEAAALNKKLADSIALLQAKYTELTRATATGTKTLLQEQSAIREKLRLATLVAKGVNDQVTAYQKLDAEYKKAVLAAKELGAVHGSNSGIFIRESAQVNKLADELKAIDGRLGSHTRSVGNYASGWNGLSNSINQLTREAPAFANSMQTGFMALSNNIPIFVDELENVRLKNIALAESGEQTESVFDAVSGAFFSWQTLLSVGVTLVTIYGAQLIELMKGAGSAKAAIDRLNKAQEKSNELFRLGDDAIDHQIFMMKEKAKQAGKTQDQIDAIDERGSAAKLRLRVEARNALQEEFDLATKAREIGAKQLQGRYQAQLVQFFSNRKKMRHLSKEDANQAKKDQELERMSDLKSLGATEKERLLVLANSSDEAYEILRQKLAVAQGLTEQSGAEDSRMRESNRTRRVQEERDDAEKRKTESAKEREERLIREEEARKLSYEADLSDLERKKEITSDELNDFRGGINERIQISTQLALRERDIVNRRYEEAKRLAKGNDDLLVVATNDQITALENTISDNAKRIAGFYKDVFGEAKNAFPDTVFGDKYKMTQEQKEDLKEHERRVKEVADSMRNYLGSFVSDFGSNSGLTETMNILSGEVAGFGKDFAVTFNAIAEAGQEVFNKISQASQANFEGEYKRLQSQKEIALQFAGDSDFAKERIEMQAEERRKQIANREFKAKQKMAIFNIAIDTAQAIVSTYAQVPKFDFGISATALAIAIGGIGAVQIAAVAAQKVPQYFEGGTHDGGLMMVNDAKGSNYKETIVTPDGKIIKPEGRDVVMNAPKGTQIFTPEQWQEKELHNMLQSKGISMNESYHNNSGLTYQEMDAILGKHFKNITTQTTTFDKKGFSSYSVSKGNKTIRNENRASGQGFKV